MEQTLEQLLASLAEDQNLLHCVEEATKQGVILPILSSLGWNCFNLREVSPEFSVGSGRIDYCLRINQKNLVFIEVKRITEELERHERQLLEYSFSSGIELAVLTNGLVWWFFLPLLGGNWDQRKFFAIDIRQLDHRVAARHFYDFLGRLAIADGTALTKAKAVKESKERIQLIRQTIPCAWDNLTKEPSEELLDLFAEKVESLCGHRPEIEELRSYLLDGKPTSPPKTGPGPQIGESPQLEKRLTRTRKTPSDFIAKRDGVTVEIQGKSLTATDVRDLYYQVLKYLCESNQIERLTSQIPFATSSVRYLISRKPIHQRGNKFRGPVEYKGYFMEAHKDYKNALNHLESFLRTCGITMRY